MASNPSTRLVVVDDTDTNIKYNGQGWFQDQGSLDQIGNFGPTYLHTLHGTQSNSSLTFPFNGTNVHVYGTTEIRNVSGIADPTWECFIDGISFSTSSTTNIPPDENNWLLCEPPSPFPDGLHELTINITTRGGTFWIDDIQYAPSPNASLDSASVLVDNSDPDITFGSGWQALGSTANMSLKTGAIMQFNFVGKSISWYAFIPTELSHAPASATYSINGGPPVQFLLSGLPANSKTSIYNQLLFTTPDLTPGLLHTLLVTNQGNSSTTPLPLDYLIITNGSIPNSSSLGSSSSTPSSGFSSSTSSSGSSSSHSSSSSQTSTVHASGGSKAPTGTIVGSVIGGLVFLIALFTFVFFWRKRKRNLADQATYNAQQPHTFDPGNVPYHDVSPLDNTQIPRPHKYSSELVPVRVGQIPCLPSIDADSSHGPTPARFSDSTDAETPYDNSDSQYGEVNKQREVVTG